jgi:riboflavin kinase/FMN adenylyltransferase
VLTIGTFDGLHLGHQALVARAVALADSLGLPARMLSFEPMPREHLNPDDPPARLTNLRERWRLLAGTGLEGLHLLTFNEPLRRMDGAQFMELLQRLGARAVVVGHDFRFGHRGLATADWCRSSAGRHGFVVEVVEPVLAGAVRASSGLVRGALEANDFPRARSLLGRAYSMRGRVRRGAQLGRRLGFPTANLAVHRRRSALAGIYAVRVSGAGLDRWPAVASLGTRPMVGGVDMLLEACLFDWSGDLYGVELEVEFAAFLRDEQRFESMDAMVAQMHRDAAAARAQLAALG